MITYKSLKIFIATPGDLKRERKIFIDVLSEVNDIKAKTAGYYLEPIGWEKTLPSNGRPQSLINKDILECDLFIMVLWQRWGTSTGEYSSGTEEEYYVALDNYDRFGKPNMWLFFKDMTDSNNNDAISINNFKMKIEIERRQLYQTFSSSNQWEKLLRRLLCKWLDSLNINKFIGKWYSSTTSNTFEDTYIKGGYILEIQRIENDYISGCVSSISASLYNRVASFEFNGRLINNELKVDFKDSFSNEGSASIYILQEKIKFYIDNTVMSEENRSGWGIFNDILFEKRET